MVGPFRPQPDAGPVRQPEPPPFWLARRYLQAFAPPNASHARHAHIPARRIEQGRDASIAVAAIGACQSNDVSRQPRFVVAPLRRLALRRAMLPERPTGAALGDVKGTLNVLDAGTPPRGA